jgi:asparagine synthase (glutamine-hydrolysing)
MSGLAGVWNLDERPLDPHDLSAVASAVVHRGGDLSSCWSNGPIGLSCHLLRVTPESSDERQPTVDTHGNVLVFDGRLDNRRELLDLLGSADCTPDCPDSTLVLAARQAWGEQFLSRLNGEFALAVFDSQTRTLSLARDPVGLRPLYYWSGKQVFAFASEVKGLLAHPLVSRKPNENLLADFCVLNQLPYDDEGETFFDSIHAVRPGHVIRIAAGHARSERFWDFDPRAQVRYRTRGEYADRLRDLLVQAVRRRLRNRFPVAIATSGGLDSSIVMCIARDLQEGGDSSIALLPISVLPESPTEETQFLDILKSVRGPVHCVAPGPPLAADELTSAAWHSEWPRCDDGWAVQRPMIAWARAHGARTLLTGHWSDQLFFATGYLSDLFARLAWRQVSAHLHEYARWFVDADRSYFRSRFRREVFFNLTSHAWRARFRPVRNALTRSHAKPFLNPAWTARTRRARPSVNRTRAATAHARDIYQVIRTMSHRLQFEADEKLAAGCGIEAVTPFLDRDLIAFLMSIPGDVVNRNGVPRALLRDSMRGIVPDAILARRWRAEGFSSPAFGRRRAEAYLSASIPLRAAHAAGLLPDSRPAGPDSVELIGLECWSRAFFSDTLAPPRPSAKGACESMEPPATPNKDGDARLPYSAPTLTVHGDLRTITAAKGSNRDEAGQPKTYNATMP